MSTENAPVTIDALMALVNRYAEACDDLGADLFAQDATKHAALHEAASAVYAQIRAAIGQYGKEQYARGANDAWPAGRGSGEPVAMLHDDGHWTHPPGRDPLDRFSGKVRMEVYAAPQPPREPLTDEQTQALRDVTAERKRQIAVEGWTPEHDDEHDQLPGDMAFAAACYATAEAGEAPPAIWPWEWAAWKPKDRRRNMVRAAALLLAEIERLDRAAPK